MSSFVGVEGTLPAGVADRAKGAAAELSFPDRSFKMSRFSVFGPHAAVEKGSDDGKPVAWIILLVK